MSRTGSQSRRKSVSCRPKRVGDEERSERLVGDGVRRYDGTNGGDSAEGPVTPSGIWDRSVLFWFPDRSGEWGDRSQGVDSSTRYEVTDGVIRRHPRRETSPPPVSVTSTLDDRSESTPVLTLYGGTWWGQDHTSFPVSLSPSFPPEF